MKCKQVRELMGAYLYGDLTPSEMKEVRLHTQECAECRQDLESRGKTISLLSDKIPALDDNARQQIAWSVRGAVRARRSLLRSWLAPICALAGIVLIGFTAGRLLNSHESSPGVQANRLGHSGAPKAVVKVTEEEQTAEAKDQEKTGRNQASKQGRTRKRWRSITDNMAEISNYGERFVRPAVVGSRNGNQQPNKAIAPEEPARVVPGHDSSKASGERTKLPAPTDLNNAQTAPGSTGE
ncbi:MAG: zf-HC2 domain-containing protein [Armatimonadota bacterium]|nr:zf-HC2 domain-containing protein [bacterium]